MLIWSTAPTSKNPFPARAAAAPYSLAPNWLCSPTKRRSRHSRSPQAGGPFTFDDVDVRTLPLKRSSSPCLPVNAIPLGRRPHPSDSISKSFLRAGDTDHITAQLSGYVSAFPASAQARGAGLTSFTLALPHGTSPHGTSMSTSTERVNVNVGTGCQLSALL